VIPFFKVNIKDETLWVRNKTGRLSVLGVVVAGLTVLLVRFGAWDALAPVWGIGIFMAFAAMNSHRQGKGFRVWLSSKPLSFWIMTWFLMEAITLTAVGTFFRGPGWSLVWPWATG
ncbi:MAG TPA: hypothetical protein VJ723_11045, partial [Candidatus Angelobacter sp.]|nr:hypothetical protein [Candidatus Angelobacter sp.]